LNEDDALGEINSQITFSLRFPQRFPKGRPPAHDGGGLGRGRQLHHGSGDVLKIITLHVPWVYFPTPSEATKNLDRLGLCSIKDT